MSPRLNREFDFEALRERANRERAEPVYRLLLRPIAQFFRWQAPVSRAVPAARTRATA